MTKVVDASILKALNADKVSDEGLLAKLNAEPKKETATKPLALGTTDQSWGKPIVDKYKPQPSVMFPPKNPSLTEDVRVKQLNLSANRAIQYGKPLGEVQSVLDGIKHYEQLPVSLDEYDNLFEKIQSHADPLKVKGGSQGIDQRTFDGRYQEGYSATPSVDLGISTPEALLGAMKALITRNPSAISQSMAGIVDGSLVKDALSDDPIAVGRTQARVRLIKDAVSSGVLQAKTNVRDWVGGNLQAIGENIPVAQPIMLGNTGLGIPTGTESLKSIANYGKEIVSGSQEMKDAIGVDGRPNADSVEWRLEHGGRAPAPSDYVKFYTEQAIANAPNTLLTSGAAIAGAPPVVLGSLTMLPTLGQTYAQNRSGMIPDSPEMALRDAGISSIIEYIGESPILDALGKSKFARAAIVEPISEALTGGSQSIASDSVHGREVNLKEAWKQTQDGAVLGAITSLAYAGAGAVVPESRASKLFEAVNDKNSPVDVKAAAMIELATLGYNETNTEVVNNKLTVKANSGVGKEESANIVNMMSGKPEGQATNEQLAEVARNPKTNKETALAALMELQNRGMSVDEKGNLVQGVPEPVTKPKVATTPLGKVGQQIEGQAGVAPVAPPQAPVEAPVAPVTPPTSPTDLGGLIDDIFGTPKGQQETVPQGGEVVSPLSEPTTPPAVQPLGGERRTNEAERKRIDDLTIEEARKELRTDPLTGGQNRRAYDEAPKRPVQVSTDMDGLKAVNDTFGHSAGDTLIKAYHQTLIDNGLEVYRLGGDEFDIQFETHEDADAKIQKAQA